MASQLTERLMYGEQYKLVHNPHARGSQPRYTVTKLATDEVTKPKGVTTKIGEVLPKDLTSWALDCMEGAILARLAEVNLLDDGMLTEDDVANAKLESTRRRDSGAGTGTEVHAMIERYLKTGEDADLTEVSKEAQKAYGAFVKWFNKVRPTIMGIEEIVYSPSLQYAGTYDAILEVNGKLYLVDFKTTNASRRAPKGVYPEYFIQLGGYARAVFEEYPEAKIDGVMVVSVRKDGKLDVVTNEDIGLTVKDCVEAFEDLMLVGDHLSRLKTALGGE